MTNRFFQTAAIIFLLAASTLSLRAATIYVTNLNQEIGTMQGCSLQDAISSANLNSTLEIASYDPVTHVPQVVQSSCDPGTPGGNTIVLPAGAVFKLGSIVDDEDNAAGPTATRMITSNITIDARGATLQWIGGLQGRLFTVSPYGSLTIDNAYIKGFRAHGGAGNAGGAGGMGAGGAIFVMGGQLTLEHCTFDGNSAVGGNGSEGADVIGGGGGGVGGDGLVSPHAGGFFTCGGSGGAGGGGARGSGAFDCYNYGFDVGFGGGGTVFDAQGPPGGFNCGGAGGSDGSNGQDAPCPGGGGGGGGRIALLSSGNGGKGEYGGGGGGGADGGGNGGDGGFGGGGGAGNSSISGGTTGGQGGFGGGGGGSSNGTFGKGHAGTGGLFGGDGDIPSGGGGAGLGGAVFNDGGTVLIENSTFTNNVVTRGLGGYNFLGDSNQVIGNADNGADAGGAIFSRNGSLTVTNVTISGNQGTGSGGGITVVGDGQTAYFALNDTIIFNNGSLECFVSGPVSITSAGNLIGDLNVTGNTPKSFLPCPSPVTNVDPHLGPLQLNAPGTTPTMALSKTSSAFNAGVGALLQTDPQLQADQRGEPRPSMGGPDIGAFELWVDKFFTTCQLPPPTAMTQFLTVLVSPAGEGTTNPSGRVSEAQNSVAVIQTTPKPGFSFLNWTGPVSDPISALTTTVIQESDVTVTANYITGTTILSGGIQVKTGAMNVRLWPITIADVGVVVAHYVSIDSFTLTQTFGTACVPFRLNNPLIGDIAPGAMVTVNLLFDFSSCAPTARFTVLATFSANNGGVTGTMTRTNQLP